MKAGITLATIATGVAARCRVAGDGERALRVALRLSLFAGLLTGALRPPDRCRVGGGRRRGRRRARDLRRKRRARCLARRFSFVDRRVTLRRSWSRRRRPPSRSRVRVRCCAALRSCTPGAPTRCCSTPASAEQLTVRSSGPQFACDVRGATLRDSFCISSGPGGRGAGMSVAVTTDYAYLRNVTAVATGASSAGLRSRRALGGAASLTGYNVIARGAGVDIVSRPMTARSPRSTSTTATTPLEASSARKASPRRRARLSTRRTRRCSSTRANGDFHQADESPTIEHGTFTFGASSEDVDGQARVQGFGIDIGADEYVPGSPPADLNPPDTKILKGPVGQDHPPSGEVQVRHHRAGGGDAPVQPRRRRVQPV